MNAYLIGQIARRANTTPETIRLYERRIGDPCRVGLDDLVEGGCLGPALDGAPAPDDPFPLRPPDVAISPP